MAELMQQDVTKEKWAIDQEVKEEAVHTLPRRAKDRAERPKERQAAVYVQIDAQDSANSVGLLKSARRAVLVCGRRCPRLSSLDNGCALEDGCTVHNRSRWRNP